MSTKGPYEDDLDLVEAIVFRMKERLFNDRDPENLETAMNRHFAARGKWPAFKQYWDTLIEGLKKNIEKRGK